MTIKELEQKIEKLRKAFYAFPDEEIGTKDQILADWSETRRELIRAKRLERTGHAGYVHRHGPLKGQPIVKSSK
jgi:hypothetical protein